MARLGFGFVECGTVTPKPQAGNPRPRLFRLRRRSRRDQPHGLQQWRHGGGGAQSGAQRRARESSASISAPTRTAPTASPIMRDAFAPACAAGRLCHGQCLLAQHAGPARPAEQGRADARCCGTDSTAARRQAFRCCSRSRRIWTARRWTISPRWCAASGIEGLIVSNTTIARPALKSAHARRERRPFRHAAVRALDRDPAPDARSGWDKASCWSAWAALPRAPTPMPRSAPAPSWCSFIPRWSFRARAWSARIKRELAWLSGARWFCQCRAMRWAQTPKLRSSQRVVEMRQVHHALAGGRDRDHIDKAPVPQDFVRQ